jgi:hypothetical protein
LFLHLPEIWVFENCLGEAPKCGSFHGISLRTYFLSRL